MFAADAVARLSGVVGVAAVTAGPGKRNNVFLILSCLSFEIQDILFQMKFSLRLEWFSMLFSNNHKSQTFTYPRPKEILKGHTRGFLPQTTKGKKIPTRLFSFCTHANEGIYSIKIK